MPQSDNTLLAALLSRIAAGDKAAFATLYQQTSAYLYGVALRVLRRADWAEETLHDSFLQIWRHAADYRPGFSQPSTWLTHIVRHRAIDALRLRDNQWTPNEQAVSEATAEMAALDEQMMTHDLTRRMTHCLQQLSLPQRQCLALAYYQNYSQNEIATVLNQPAGTVKSWIRRALMHLKECVGI